MNAQQIQAQRALAVSILNYHGGQWSAVYAVGSCMLADANYATVYSAVRNFHTEKLPEAIQELKQDSESKLHFNAKERTELKRLIQQLQAYLPS